MRPMQITKPHQRRHGLTLIEMMVSVALLVLLMTILVTIFASASGSLQEQQTYAALDMELRRIDATLRLDLAGTTAKMTPPNNPVDGKGYFEYAENALCDAQGEDSDDTLRFTAKAPEGKPFTGRMWVPRSVPVTDLPAYGSGGARSVTRTPITVTSQHAEIIYFLRNGNLYRRVLLIKPEVAGLLHVGNSLTDPPIPPDQGTVRPGPTAVGFATDAFRPVSAFSATAFAFNGGYPLVGWSAGNDISAVPSNYPGVLTQGGVQPAAIPLYDPVNRQDYRPRPNTLGMLTDRHNRAFNPRFSDDYRNADPNGPIAPDGIPDDFNADGVPDFYPTLYPSAVLNGFLNERFPDGTPMPPPGPRLPEFVNVDVLAFPYIFPQAYSAADPFTAQNGLGWIHSLNPDPNIDIRTTTYLNPPYNHNPIDIGDSLPLPTAPQTWWGFPTWRESASPYWLGNLRRLNDPLGSRYYQALTNTIVDQSAEVSPLRAQTSLLSWMRRGATGAILPVQNNQPFNDGTGNPNYFDMPSSAVWEDDLLATNVRSFDVKAYDPNAAMWDTGLNRVVALPSDYYDLGYQNFWGPGAQGLPAGVSTHPGLLGSFAHEGRMPPLPSDFRVDPNYGGALGDIDPNVIRMRRVWDSWSTTYTNAPALPVDPTTGPLSGQPPVYPSYPAPYPAPLSAIQIKIRMTDPDGKRVKNLTIRHDFTNKL